MRYRIQRKRTKGWKAPAGAVYIGRHSSRGKPRTLNLFANPYTVEEYGRLEAVAKFRAYLQTLPAWDLEGRLASLAGVEVLMCWCPLTDAEGQHVPCHGDVWLELLAARTTD